MDEFKVLGIDCGTATVGWSIISKRNNCFYTLGFGLIQTKKNELMPFRLKKIYNELEQIIKKYKPRDIAVEAIYFFKNQKTIISVSQARGVILLCGQNNNLKLFDYTPLQVKSAVTGYGRAEKEQVRFMINKILKLDIKAKYDDITDALALSICHLNSI